MRVSKSPQPQSARKKISLFEILLAAAFVGAIAIGIALGLAMAATRSIQRREAFGEHAPALPTRILDINDRPITEFFGDEKREMVTIDEVPPHLVQALLTREDREFYSHHGFSLRGLLRAVFKIVTGQYVSGASTITQQLAGRLYADRSDISIRRKLVELWWAIQMERRYTKQEILEMYLNEMPFGHNTQGVGAASQFFFRKPVREITLAESAMLAIQLAKPGLYSPIKNPQRAQKMQREILSQMVKLGYVTRAEADTSFGDYWAHWDSTRTGTAFSEREDLAPYFSEYIRGQLDEMLFGSYDYLRDGLVVHTTLNLDYQKAADRIMAESIDDVNARYLALANNRLTFSNAAYLPLIDLLGLTFNIEDFMYRNRGEKSKAKALYTKQLNPVVELMAGMFGLEAAEKIVSAGFDSSRLATKKTQVQGAMVAIDSRKGYILAMVGGRKFERTDQFNRATSAQVEPGSAFKPLYYSAAIDSRKFTPATMILDAPVVFTNADGTSYEPLNYKGRWYGRVLLRTALAQSMNVPSLKVLDGIGFDAAIQRASRMLGITDPAEIERVFPRYYPLGLGVIAVSPLQMARAFATFPNEGREVVPLAIRYIEDRNGKVILEPEKELRAQQSRKGEGAQIMPPQTAFIMTSILQSTVREGTLAGVTGILEDQKKRPMAGKTGTTQNWSDAWTVGFSPQVTTAVWYGFDEGNRSLGTELTGAAIAGPTWARFMKEVHANLPPEQFTRPESGIVSVNVSATSGLLPTAYTKRTITEVFLAGTEPKAFDQIDEYNSESAQTIESNLQNSLLGTSVLGGGDTGLPALTGTSLPDPGTPATGNPLLE
jgi:penicillin-binding protein 1A